MLIWNIFDGFRKAIERKRIVLRKALDSIAAKYGLTNMDPFTLNRILSAIIHLLKPY